MHMHIHIESYGEINYSKSLSIEVQNNTYNPWLSEFQEVPFVLYIELQLIFSASTMVCLVPSMVFSERNACSAIQYVTGSISVQQINNCSIINNYPNIKNNERCELICIFQIQHYFITKNS